MKSLSKILIILALLGANYCFGQSSNNADYKQFINTFPQIIDYPVELMRNCVPTVCLIRIKVDSQKTVTDMQLSDSADSLLKVEFTRRKNNLNIRSLERYIKTEYANNSCSVYIIPLSYSLYQMPCPPQTVNITSLYGYTEFNGKGIQGNVIFLDPIYSKKGVQR